MSSFGLNAESREEWRQHWPVIMAVVAGLSIGHIHMYAMGLMIDPLQTEFGWTRAQISSGLLLSSVLSVPLSPLVGMLIDRYGSRYIGLCGVGLYCLGLAGLGLAQKELWTWWALWLFLSIGFTLLRPTVWIAAIASLFHSSRGLALAIGLSASGLATIVTPLLTYFLIHEFGWRLAFVLWGCIGAAIALPVMYAYFRAADGRSFRHTPVLISSPAISIGQAVPATASFRNPTIYRMSLAAAAVAFTTAALTLNLVLILNEQGLDTRTAAAIVGLFGVAQIVGRLGCGFFLDRLDARYLGAAIVASPILTFILLLLSDGSALAAAGAVLVLGLAVGAEVDVLGYLGSRYFQGPRFGTLFSFVVASLALGSGLGPVAANLIFDVTGSYHLVLWAAIPLLAISSLLFLTLGPYPTIARAADR